MTGGAKGIGLMIAEGFVTNGATVYITGRDASACASASASLSKLGTCHAIPADLQSLTECERLVAELTARSPGGVHVLVNNAGATWGDAIETYPEAAWDKVLTLNLKRAFTLTQLLLPAMERAGSAADPARVIHIGSIDGLRAPQFASFAYSASKAGLHHLSRHLARDLGGRNVTSNTLACGAFPTKMTKQMLRDFGDVTREETPLRRVGDKGDVAGACLFLASRAGAWVTGATIRLDGGASLVSKL